jgi:hypothetical protein
MRYPERANRAYSCMGSHLVRPAYDRDIYSERELVEELGHLGADRESQVSQKPELTIDIGKLDWTPEERRKARHIIDTEQHAETRERIAAKYREQRKQQKQSG